MNQANDNHLLQQFSIYKMLMKDIKAFIYRSKNDAIWSLDFLTDEVFDITGYSATEFYQGKISLQELVHHQDKRLVDEMYRQVLVNKKTYELSYRIICADRSTKWVLEKGNLVIDEISNEVSCKQGIVIEISSQKHTDGLDFYRRREEIIEKNPALLELHNIQQQLEKKNKIIAEQQAEFDRMLMILPEMIFQYKQLYDGNATFTFTSHGINSLFGKKDGSFTNVNTFLELMHPDFREDFKQKILRSAKIGGDMHWEGRFVLENGTTPWLAAHFVLEKVEIDGAIFTGVFRNITYKKESEKRREKRLSFNHLLTECSKELLEGNMQKALDALLNGSKVSRVYIFENFINEENILSMKQLYESCETPLFSEIGLDILQNFPYQNSFLQQSIHILENNELIFGMVSDFQDSEKKYILNQNIKSVLIIPIFVNKKWYGFIGFDENKYERIWTGEDIYLLRTAAGMIGAFIEKQQADLELQKAKEMAEIAARAKAEFLANMSHEIRTPMNAVLGFADMLANAIDDPRLQSYIDAIRAGGKSLLTIINDILDLSKIEAGKMELKYETVNLKGLLKEIEQIFSLKVKQKGLIFNLHIDSDLPTSLLIDEVRLRQILFNLIGNAVKFTDEGFINLKLSIIEKNASTLDLIIEVEDSGIGIPKENQAFIFDAFVQQGGQSSKKYGGTGLGLAITKRLVQMMGGEISLDSDKGKGAAFSIILRQIKILETTDNKKINLLSDNNYSTEINFEPCTVFICDDVPANRFLIRTFFENSQVRIFETQNGKELIELMHLHLPNLVLLDIRMPVMDGYQAINYIKSITDWKNIPVLALTASVLNEDKDKILRHGFDSFLTKPIHKNDLFKELIKYLPYKKTDTYFENSLTTQNSEEDQAAFWQALEVSVNEWKTISENSFINEIEDFGIRLIKLATQFNQLILQQYAETLVLYVGNFDIENINTCLQHFPEILKKLKN